MKKSVSIIVPAYNEEGNLNVSLQEMVAAGERLPDGYEIILVNDCSTDKTLELAQAFSVKHPAVRVINNPVNLGFGGAFREGLRNAQMNYSVMVCADNCIDREELYKIVSHTGEADIVIPYIANKRVRVFGRRLLSAIFTETLNFLFKFNLEYYNGHNVFPTKVIQKANFTPGFAFSAEILIRLIKNGYSYVQVPMVVQPRLSGETKAFKLKNILLTVGTIMALFFEVTFFKTRSARVLAKKDAIAE